MNVEQTFLALRVTAFASSFLFSAYYWSGARRFWNGFVLAHTVHFGFIVWLGAGLHYPLSAFTLIAGGIGYLVLDALAVGEWLSPGTLRRFSFGVHFLWLNLLGTYVMQIAHAWTKGTLDTRVHSFVAATLLLAAAVKRWRDSARSRLARAAAIP